jgi:hypothetical protein
MPADFCFAVAQFARPDTDADLRFGILHPEQLVRHEAVELPVQPEDVGKGCRESRRVAALINCLLDCNMRNCLKLESTTSGLSGIVTPECPVDILRMRVVPLDEVLVIAVHGPDERSDGCGDDGAGLTGQRAGTGD